MNRWNPLKINLGRARREYEGEEQFEKDLIAIDNALFKYMEKHGLINVFCAENHGLFKLPPPEKLRELTEEEKEICQNRKQLEKWRILFPDKYKLYDENNIPERGIRRI